MTAFRAESRSMRIAFGINLVMALAGVLASWWTEAQALALDGLVSGLNASAILVAERLSSRLGRPQDRRYPFGYWALETLYTGGRSLLLLGIILFAATSSIARIITHLRGVESAIPRFALIAPYSITMVALCLMLACIHHHYWKQGGAQSRLLAVEKRGALIDGAISAGVGVAFALTPLLSGTSLADLIPISDAIVVLILCGLLISSPLSMLLTAARELVGEAAHPRIRGRVQALLRPDLDALNIKLVDLAIFPSGRAIQGILYLQPAMAIHAEEVDQLRLMAERSCRREFSVVTLEIVLTGRAPLPRQQARASGRG